MDCLSTRPRCYITAILSSLIAWVFSADRLFFCIDWKVPCGKFLRRLFNVTFLPMRLWCWIELYWLLLGIDLDLLSSPAWNSPGCTRQGIHGHLTKSGLLCTHVTKAWTDCCTARLFTLSSSLCCTRSPFQLLSSVILFIASFVMQRNTCPSKCNCLI